jgi:predicted MFS family arabinose efflux permease
LKPVALWPAGVVFLCAEAGGYLMPLLLGPVTATYGIGEGVAGMVMAVQLGAFAVAAISLSPWLASFSPRRGAALAVAMIVAGDLISAAQPAVWSLVAGRVVAGLGEGIAAAVATSVIARTADPDRAFARVFIAVVLMSLAFFLLLPAVMAGRDARLLFLGMALLPLLALPAIPALSDTVELAERRPQAAGPLSLQAAALCAAIALFSVAANAYWVYLERIATSIGMTPTAYGQAFAIGAVCALAGPVAAERLGMRVGRLPPLVLACALLAGGGWLATHATAPLGLVSGITVSSAALLFGMPYLLGLAAEVDPTGRVAGAGRGFNNIGSACAPALAGAVLGLTGAYTSIGWTSVAAAAAALGLILVIVRHRPGAR